MTCLGAGVNAVGDEEEDGVEDDDEKDEGDNLDSKRTLIFLSLSYSEVTSDLRLRDDDFSSFGAGFSASSSSSSLNSSSLGLTAHPH